MKDLTQGSISRQLVAMAVPIAIGMLFQTLYYLIDLYFVSRLGDEAIAGVSAAGTVTFVVLALTQVLAVGTTTLISHAAGRKDQPEANLIFNQSVVLAALCAALTLAAGFLLSRQFLRGLAADAASAQAGASYLYAYALGLALQFPITALASALRGTGIVKPVMTVQMLSVILNAILAPVLIAGWGTGHPLGTAGAGLASTIAVTVGGVLLWAYFARLEHYVGFARALWRPDGRILRGILNVGLPAGGEFFVMFVILAVIYWVIRPFGPAAQAGFGIGGRVMQALFLPAMAVAFAVAPVAGQNFGARRFDRVRETFRQGALISCVLMAVLTVLCQWRPELFIVGFNREPPVVAVGATYLRVISWNFVAMGIVFSCSGLFQALGNTVPSLLSSASRLVTFVVPAVWLSTRPGFTLMQVWYLSVATVALQALTSLWLLRREFRRRLALPAPASPATATVAAVGGSDGAP
jgi:putative MATE family efflux protein